MKCNSGASAKVIFGTFNTLFFACGFVEVVCGFLLLSDSKRILLSRLLASPESELEQPPLYYLALALLAAGLAVCALAALGCWATYMPGYTILTIYFLVVLALVLCECAGGVVAALWPRCFGLAAARGGAVAALQAYYALADYEQFTAAVDLAQTQLQCCGITDARNYDMSVWQLRRLGPRGLSVPASCCVQRGQPDALSPAPLDAARCQDILPNAAFRHVPGCLTKLEEWYEQQYFIFMLSIFVTALLKLGILLCTVFSCIQLRKRRQIVHSVTIQSVDRNDNIYESRLHGEPIMAKYVQPNNFYSPRVRNPRIFPNKPNEML